jgi:hypothetical protein
MKNIFPFFALAVLFFFCGSILLRIVVNNVLIDNGVENRFTDIVFFGAKEYLEPATNNNVKSFDERVKEKLQIKTEQNFFYIKDKEEKRRSFYERMKARTKKYAEGNLLLFRKYLAQVSILIDFSLGNKILPNEVLDLGDGYLMQLIPKNSIMDMDASVKKIEYFKHILDSLGIPLVYAQYPDVICDEDEASKTGKDQTMQKKNEFMPKLEDLNIPVIDLHKEFHKRANNNSKEFHHSLFYKTDHHWQAKTSIWAGKIISEKLNELYGFGLETELLDSNNFTEKFVEKWLGSMGGKVIPLYPKEDFHIYSPKYATDLTLVLKDAYKDLFYEGDGSFDNFYHFISGQYNFPDNSAYYTYTPFSLSLNNNLPNGKKILIIGDSFNVPLSKFLALIFKEVYLIFGNSNLLDTYLANKPDVVILGYSDSPYYLILAEDLIF